MSDIDDLMIEAQRVFKQNVARLNLSSDLPESVRHRETLGVMLSSVLMVYGAHALGAAQGERPRSEVPHFQNIVAGAIAATIYNLGSTYKFCSPGRVPTALESAADWSAAVICEVKNRVRSFAEAGPHASVCMKGDAAGRLVPDEFDFRDHLKGARP